MIESRPGDSNTTSPVQSNEPAFSAFESGLSVEDMKSTTRKRPWHCAGFANCSRESQVEIQSAGAPAHSKTHARIRGMEFRARFGLRRYCAAFPCWPVANP